MGSEPFDSRFHIKSYIFAIILLQSPIAHAEPNDGGSIAAVLKSKRILYELYKALAYWLFPILKEGSHPSQLKFSTKHPLLLKQFSSVLKNVKPVNQLELHNLTFKKIYY